MASHRLTKWEPVARFSGSAPERLKSTAALPFPIQAAGAELLKEALTLLMPRLREEFPGALRCHLILVEIVPGAPVDLAPAPRDLLLEVMLNPCLQARYLEKDLPLVPDVRVGLLWAETH